MKLSDPGFIVAGFDAMGFPNSIVIAILLGLLEFVGGLMLLTGSGTRLAALALFVIMAYPRWAGAGALALDNRLSRRFAAQLA